MRHRRRKLARCGFPLGSNSRSGLIPPRGRPWVSSFRCTRFEFLRTPYVRVFGPYGTFLGSDRGGKTMAVLRSFVTSCELAKVDPFAWFQDVLASIGECSMQQLDELLPHRWAARPARS